MKSDRSRDTFHPEKHYSGVRLQQGRVITDADWNEEDSVLRHRNRVTTRDLVGPSGVPLVGGGFQITPRPVLSGGTDLFVSPGNIYVDGVMCELESPISYTAQPDFPARPSRAAVRSPTCRQASSSRTWTCGSGTSARSKTRRSAKWRSAVRTRRRARRP